jgi:hypothetical protein
MRPGVGERVWIDLRKLPISRLVQSVLVRAANAVQFTSTGADVEVYRDDPKDAPKRINVDRYAVIEDIELHVDLPGMMGRASTEDNANLRAYLGRTVFLVKKDPGPDHHLSELPAYVIMRSTST